MVERNHLITFTFKKKLSRPALRAAHHASEVEMRVPLSAARRVDNVVAHLAQRGHCGGSGSVSHQLIVSAVRGYPAHGFVHLIT